MLLCPALVHHLQMLAQRCTNDCAENNTIPAIMLPVLWPTSMAIADCLCPAIGKRRWLNAGSTLLLGRRRWPNTGSMLTTRLSFMYIPFFRLTSWNYPSCQTNVVLITANKIEMWWQPCMVLTLPAREGWQSPNDYYHGSTNIKLWN